MMDKRQAWDLCGLARALPALATACIGLTVAPWAGAAGPAGAVAAVPVIGFADQAPQGLVGNGRSVVKTAPDGFEYIDGGTAKVRLALVVGGRELPLASMKPAARFWPGAVEYRMVAGGMSLRLLHGALDALPHVLVLDLKGASGPVSLRVEAGGDPLSVRSGTHAVPLRSGAGQLVFGADDLPQRSYEDWRAAFVRPYGPQASGLHLRTPDARIDRAVPFNSFLLDLGFNGRLHVCEIFRWRDVWSRDLGSGLVPGALASGRFAAAHATLDYDLQRYARADPRGLKASEDPSQGGSAEGLAWLLRALWREYLLSADVAALRRATTVLQPWVDAWLERDADDQGLVVDTSEWMDHSRFFLFPDGARVLYSNVLFAGALRTLADIRGALGEPAAAQQALAQHQRFVAAINRALWNEALGRYDNLLLWGRRDERSSQDGNVLALLNGVVPPARVPRVLAAVRAANWRAAGSSTIWPPMNHVDAWNDHNHKVWPWWNAVEARARLRAGDLDGGLQLLRAFSKTLDDPAFPGLVEELSSPDGVSEGGHAFVTAAGAYQDAIVEGLLGLDVLEPGRRRLRVQPHVPVAWRDWQASVPLPGGTLRMQQRQGVLSLTVDDPAVQAIEVPAGVRVSGALALPLSARSLDGRLLAGEAVASGPEAVAAPRLPPLPVRQRTMLRLAEPGLPLPDWPGLPERSLDVEQLAAQAPRADLAIVLPGNALPRRTRDGVELTRVLDRLLNAGGAVVFYGATMHDRQTMGEHAGVVDWFDWRPRIDYQPLPDWSVRSSDSPPDQPAESERGRLEGWQRESDDEAHWQAATLPVVRDLRRPDGAGGVRHGGWLWLRTRFELPASARGRPVVVELGRINLQDHSFVNGVLLGSRSGEHEFRSYRIEPGTPAYDALQFGASNRLAVQIRSWGREAALGADPPAIGIEADEPAWVPLDGRSGEPRRKPVRFGVVSWGPGPFFASWETSVGAFGFEQAGLGLRFVGPLAGLPPLDDPTQAAFTDFAVRKPWRFEVLAWTRTRRGLLMPDEGEAFPAAVRIVNTRSGGEVVLIPQALARSAQGVQALRRLGMQ